MYFYKCKICFINLYFIFAEAKQFFKIFKRFLQSNNDEEYRRLA